jgi:hypothetical protein
LHWFWPGLALAQTYLVEEHLDAITKVKCKSKIPKDFVCAIFLDLDPPPPNEIEAVGVVDGENDFALYTAT